MAVSFGIVGGGWWAEVYLRIARELPERFRVSAMVLRREEAGAAIEAEWGVPTYRTVEELVEATPTAELEFLIVCIASADNAAMLKRVAALGIPALSQCAHRSLPRFTLMTWRLWGRKRGLPDCDLSLSPQHCVGCCAQFRLAPSGRRPSRPALPGD